MRTYPSSLFYDCSVALGVTSCARLKLHKPCVVSRKRRTGSILYIVLSFHAVAKLSAIPVANSHARVLDCYGMSDGSTACKSSVDLPCVCRVMQTCDPTLGVVSADAQCSKGLECCDAACAKQTNTLNLQVGSARMAPTHAY